MSESGQSGYVTSLKSSMRLARGLGYSTQRSPYDPQNKHPNVGAVRPAPLGQWLVDRGELRPQIVARYPEMTPGVVVQMLAGTSAGKTTKVPCIIASAFNEVVLCLLPFNPGPKTAAGYVNQFIAPEMGLGGKVFLFTPGYLDKSHANVGGRVYYTTVTDFLSVYSARSDMLQSMRVKCIIVDESHSDTPDYASLQYLVAAGLFKDVKVFYMSATTSNVIDMEQNSLRQVIELDESVFPRNPDSLLPNCPAHYANIIDITMLFVACDSDFEQWHNYYFMHDVPVMCYGYSSGTTKYDDVIEFMTKYKVSVLVCTQSVESSVTLPVDTVIDNGYCMRLKTVFDPTPTLALDVIPVTKSSQKQRAGRAGRFKQGRAYVAKVKYSSPVTIDDIDIGVYVYLWLRMFNVDVKDPAISKYAVYFGDCEKRVLANLLTGMLPPLVMLSYYSDNGVYSGFHKGVKVLNNAKDVALSTENNEASVANWQEQSLDVSCFPDGERMFCAKFMLPSQFAIMGYHVWASYVGDLQDDDGASVAPTEYEAIPIRRKATLRGYTAGPTETLTQAYRKLRGVSVGTEYHAEVVVPPTPKVLPPVPSIPVNYRPVSPVSSCAASIVMPVERPPNYQPEAPKRVSTGSTNPVVAKWLASDVGSSSGSSGESIQFKLRQCTAARHGESHLYPVDALLFNRFYSSLAVTSVDIERVERLLRGTVKFSQLTSSASKLKSMQEDCFISLLKVHRSIITDLAQLGAVVVDRKYGFGSRPANLRDIENRLRRINILIDMCAHESMYVGYRSGHKHSGQSTSSRRVSLDGLLRLAAAALAAGPISTIDAINSLIAHFIPITTDDSEYSRQVGNAWHIADSVVTATHVYEAFDPDTFNRFLSSVPSSFVQHDDVTVLVVDNLGAAVDMRKPVIAEYVSVVGRDQGSFGVKTYGYHAVGKFMSGYMIEGRYNPSMSGAAVVAHADGAIVGIYGGLITSANGKYFSRFDSIV